MWETYSREIGGDLQRPRAHSRGVKAHMRATCATQLVVCCKCESRNMKAEYIQQLQQLPIEFPITAATMVAKGER